MCNISCAWKSIRDEICFDGCGWINCLYVVSRSVHLPYLKTRVRWRGRVRSTMKHSQFNLVFISIPSVKMSISTSPPLSSVYTRHSFSPLQRPFGSNRANSARTFAWGAAAFPPPPRGTRATTRKRLPRSFRSFALLTLVRDVREVGCCGSAEKSPQAQPSRHSSCKDTRHTHVNQMRETDTQSAAELG